MKQSIVVCDKVYFIVYQFIFSYYAIIFLVQMHYIVNHDTTYCFTLLRLSTVFPIGATLLVPFVVVIIIVLIVLIVLIIIVLLRFVDSLFTILLIVVLFFSFNPTVIICVFVYYPQSLLNYPFCFILP
jgi:hypothetical protein